MEVPESWYRKPGEVGSDDTWSHIPRGTAIKPIRLQGVQKIQPPKWYLGSQPKIEEVAEEEKKRKARPTSRTSEGAPELEDIRWETPSGRKRTWEKISGPKKANPKSEVRPQAINNPEQAVQLTDKQVQSILQWWNLTERYQDKAKLVERVRKTPDMEILRTLSGTFAPYGNVHLDYLNRILDFLKWCERNLPNEDPWTEAMCYRYLVHVNVSMKAGTYAGRFL